MTLDFPWRMKTSRNTGIATQKNVYACHCSSSATKELQLAKREKHLLQHPRNVPRRWRIKGPHVYSQKMRGYQNIQSVKRNKQIIDVDIKKLRKISSIMEI